MSSGVGQTRAMTAPTTPARAARRRLGALPALAGRLPWWATVLLGLAVLVLGVLLVTRPLSALGVLAVYVGASSILTGVADLPRHRWSGALWVVVGIVVLVWLGRVVVLLPVVLAAVLVVSGLVRLLGWRGERTLDGRLATALLALVDVGLGVLALAWPDVTLLLVAVLFGARAVFVGAGQVLDGLRRGLSRRALQAGRGLGADHGAGSAAAVSPHGPVHRWGRALGALGLAALVLVALAVSGRLDAASPVVDDFYTAPAVVPDEPGALLRAEPFDRDLASGAIGWRILYTTTRQDGSAALASALVAVPGDHGSAADRLAPESGRWPVVAWAHGTTGYATQCAPSLLEHPFDAGGLPDALVSAVAANDWVLVAADYGGLGTAGAQPYLIGEGEARSVLDAVRAARGLTLEQLGGYPFSDQTVVWGHSQGGHAALWTGQVQPAYAPDVPLSGVAAMAPAADAVGLAAHLPDVTGGSVFASFVAAAYEQTYDDVDLDDYTTGSARVLLREMASRCLSEPGVLVSVLSALSLSDDRPIFSADLTTGAIGARLAENVPLGAIDAPVLVAQGEADPLITPELQRAYVARRCAAGQAIEYRTYPGLDHMGLVESPDGVGDDLVAWTRRRLAGDPAPDTCP